jgi:hypothetical protein
VHKHQRNLPQNVDEVIKVLVDIELVHWPRQTNAMLFRKQHQRCGPQRAGQVAMQLDLRKQP